ncbi:MAG: SDR family oxidoreductase [Hyphomicrobiales bacterium]|nr:SDR family oxidoreductase [Hyphomicrobiales bacterium]
MRLVVLGMGYSAAQFVAQGRARFASVSVTVRSAEKAARLRAGGFEAFVLSGQMVDPALETAIRDAGALLVSIPAEDGGDPALPVLGEVIRTAPRLGWIGYLSTVGVYGDHQGAVVDETSDLRATSERGLRRIAAELGWLDLGVASGKAVQVFRLAGIYGPGRNQLVSIADGSARRIIKAGQKFSRIHVEDIAGACLASLDRPDPGAVYNVADNEPAPPQDVIAFAAGLLGLPAPREEPFDSATLSPMARSFYMDSRQISNAKLRTRLGYVMRYPTYREGLTALFRAGEGQRSR